jgi:hypothetical protein
MSDMSLLIFGIVVFGLMLTGAVLTVIEFHQLSDKGATEADSHSKASTPQMMSEDGD